MSEENNSVSTTETTRFNGYPRVRYALLFTMILIILGGIGVLRIVASRQMPAWSPDQAILQADVLTKVYYCIEWFSIVGKGELKVVDTRQALEFRDAAATQYRESFEKSPGFPSIRRLVIIETPTGRRTALQLYNRLPTSSAATSSTTGNRKVESQMWKDIYLSKGKLSSPDVKKYRKLIRDMDLGWYENPALADLYTQAGLKNEALTERSIAVDNAIKTIVPLGIVIIVLLILFVLGMFLGLFYVIRKQSSGLPGALNEVMLLPENEKSYLSGYLLEAFLFYILLFVILQLAASILLGVMLRSGEMPRPDIMAFIEAGQYLLWSGLALSYLIYRLRRAGRTLRDIGLQSTYTWQNIKWGIAGYVSGLPLVAVSALISQKLTESFKTPPNPVEPLLSANETILSQIVLFLLLAVAAPFFEEIFFRGVLFTSLRARWGTMAGIVVSSAIFAGVHPLPLGFLPIFALGSVFSILYYQRGSLIPGMIAHSLQNSMAFLLLILLSS